MSVADVLSGLEASRPALADTYRDLHQHPELGMQETRTAGIVSERLTALGHQVQRVGGGVVGVLANGPGPTVLLRADMDALPVTEATGLPYASTATATTASGETVGVMHACGHDVHVTALLGAAELLATAREAWSGTVVLVFQPAEETATGARAMVDDGLVDRVPRPDAAFGQHVLSVCPSGSVAVTGGPVLSTAASVKVTVHGKGSHGSMPHLGVDPVVVASSIVVRLQSLVSRELAPSEFGVVTVGSLQAGSVANVIPETATLRINVRAYSTQVRQQLLDGIERIVRAECAAGRCPAEPDVEVYDTYPPTTNDDGLAATVTGAFRAALGDDRVAAMPPQTASEDFSTIPDAFGVPYCYWGLGGFTDGQDVVPNHNPRFAPAIEPTLSTGVEALVVAALAVLDVPGPTGR